MTRSKWARILADKTRRGMAQIAVVGADTAVAGLVDLLAGLGTVRVVAHGLEVLDLESAPDIVVVDGRQQASTARRLCTLLPFPVLVVLNAADLESYDATWGADLLVDGATSSEIRTRVRLLLCPAPLTSAGVIIDEAGYRASVAGRPLDLTYTEFELLKFLVAHPDRVHTRNVLLAEVWGEDYFGGTRTVDVHIRRLRAKLGPEHESLIETVRQVGYRFTPRA